MRVSSILGFVFLVAEILYGFVVEQAVDRFGVRLVVGFVHVAPDDDTALAGHECKPAR